MAMSAARSVLRAVITLLHTFELVSLRRRSQIACLRSSATSCSGCSSPATSSALSVMIFRVFHRKNFIPRTDIIQNYRVGGCQTLNLHLVLCRKDRQPPTPFGIIYRAVTHDRTNFGQALKVVAVSLHDVFFAVGHRLYEVRARQDHFAQEVGHLLPL